MANMTELKKACKVQVLVRLRPEHSEYKEESNSDGIPKRCVRAVDSSTLELWNCRNSEESIRYRFHKFFDEDSTQEKIYHNSVCPLIPLMLQGQNASVFAYGPTGAGKTHTMVGSPDEPGLIPRCAAELFKLIDTHHQDPTVPWKYKVLFSYLEIYQEKIEDLLDLNKDDLLIRQDQQQNIFIPNLTEMEIETLGEFMSLFIKASHQRKTAATKLNPQSSRSHSIVLIQVQKHKQVAPVTKLIGKFYLIDLAGSEDNRKTGNEGIRLKESGAINSSLFALGQVVDALNQGLCQIPYRNSKLTRLLQDSLGGSAHSCMIANIAPEMRFYADTVNTLNFASKSRTIVNQPFVRRTIGKLLAHKRYRDVALPLNQAKRHKMDDSSATHELSKPIRKPILEPQKLTIPAEILSPLRVEQGKIHDHLAALEKLAAGQTLTRMTVLSDINVTKESPRTSNSALVQSTQCSHQKTMLTVDENLKVKINPHFQEAHRNKILKVLNDGTIIELKTLQGVGQKRAELIMNWRREYGPLQQVQDLKLINGFTDKMVTSFLKNNLLSQITFSSE
ncbi:kinesin-like protein KIF22 [Pocillopora damicornis]|uniref:kinesin-like protein KIF22 n=1 Tax=Pocillopora damicornis TaxID=46731 RepID=UPI000F5513FA|nr:kinesin-like protein KIF22 [Pocillopora damicornis]